MSNAGSDADAAIRALEAKVAEKDAAWMSEKSRAHHWEQDCKRYATEALGWNRAYLQAEADRDRLAAENAKLRSAAQVAARCIEHALYSEDGLDFLMGEPALDELKSAGIVPEHGAIDAARGAGEEK